MSERKSENYGQKSPVSFRNSLLISVAAGLAIFIGLTLYSDIRAVTQAFVEFRWCYIPLILALAFLNYFLRFCKWDYYLKSIGVRPRFKDSLAIFLSGLAMSVTPAKLGEVLKSYLLKRTDGTEVSRSVPVVFAERITDVLGLLILAAISFSAFQYGKEILIVLVVMLLALVVIIKSRRICARLIRLTESVPLINRLSDSLRIAYESTYTLFGFKNLIVATAISAISWGFECLAMYFVLVGFGVDSSILLSTFVYSFSLLVGAVSMIPGGLLVAEGSFAGLLILSGITKGVAAGATIITRFCTLWFGVLIGLIALFLIRKRLA